MQKLIFLMLGLGALIGILAPSDRPAVATAAQTAKPGLFEAPAYKVTELKRYHDGHFYVTADVNGTPITFLVDTGATTIALTEDDARSAGLDFSSDTFEPVAKTASGIAEGKRLTLPKVTIEGKEVMEVDAMVIQGAERSLLGQSYLSRISGVQMNGDIMILR